MAQAPTLVIGQGALGTVFAAALAQAGHDVHIVSTRASTPEQVHMNATGATAATGTVTLQGSYPNADANLALVCTRAQDALERTKRTLDRLTPEGGLVLVQNGLTPLDIAEDVDDGRVIPAVVGFNAHLDDRTQVTVTSKGPVTLGALDEITREAVEALADGLDGILPVRRTANPEGAVWSKWCIGCAISGLAVLTGHGVGPVTKRRAGREALVGIVTECVEVARAEGVELDRVAGPLAPDTLAGPARSGLGGWFRRSVVWGIGRAYGDVRPSAWRAFQEGRDPEIDRLNGVAVERGARAGVEVPRNRALVQLVDEILGGRREPGLDLLGELAARAG